ncbi:MAG TPA: zinc-binding alcohol dehydrogenase family protein [Phototrophicaceae bacterium]|nr:zinc-binding alcohol dehydrogenase family protein [Phototrophicaceae bacterium]
MKTIVLEQPGAFSLRDTSAPETPGQNEALVKIHRVGICGTDLHAFEGTQPFFSYPRILGHELAVEIMALGEMDSVFDFKIGEICAVNPYLDCGNCISCRRGKPNACVNLQVMGVHRDGGMREYITVPIRKLHRAGGLPVEQVALVEMLSIGAHATRRASLAAGDFVLVIGAGPIGMGTMQFARLTGAKVIAMDVNEQRLAFCRDVLGIQHTVNATMNPLEDLKQLLGGDLPTTVFDATGNSKSMANAFQYVSHGGQLVYVGIVREDITFNDPFFHSHELTLFASRNATDDDFTWVINSLKTGEISLDGWITHRATPESLIIDFAGWLKPETGVRKAMLTF